MFDELLYETKSTLSLLPQCQDSLLNGVRQVEQLLKLKKLLINHAILAIKSFFYSRRPADFDAHVGDTLCQIRGHIVLCLFDSVEQLSSLVQPKFLIKRLEKVASRIHCALERMQSKSYRFKTTTLLAYAEHEGIETEINGFIELITKSYFLSRFKYFKADDNIGIDYPCLVHEIQITKTQARKLVHEFQLALAGVSTNFIKAIARDNNHILCEHVEALVLRDEEDRSVLPCYLVMSIIYSDMLRRLPVVLVIVDDKGLVGNKTLHLTFILTSDGYQYVPMQQLERKELERPGLILHGDCYLSWEKPSDYIKRFLDIGLETILFANMAHHPQYSGKRLSIHSTDPYGTLIQTSLPKNNAQLISGWDTFYEKFIYYYKVAKEIGCCQESSSLFFIRHIYCDTVIGQMSNNAQYGHKLDRAALFSI